MNIKTLKPDGNSVAQAESSNCPEDWLLYPTGILYTFDAKKALVSSDFETLLEDEMEENQTTILARTMKFKDNITQIRDELIEDDIKKMVLMKNYHQEVENSLRFIVDEQNQLHKSKWQMFTKFWLWFFA